MTYLNFPINSLIFELFTQSLIIILEIWRTQIYSPEGFYGQTINIFSHIVLSGFTLQRQGRIRKKITRKVDLNACQSFFITKIFIFQGGRGLEMSPSFSKKPPQNEYIYFIRSKILIIPAVSEILCFRQTDGVKSFYFVSNLAAMIQQFQKTSRGKST